MHPTRRRRLIAVGFIVVGAAVALSLLLVGLGENVNMFYPPEDVVSGKAPTERNIRAGGMVLEGSWQREGQSLANEFVLTDRAGAEFAVRYTGILPDLFREGQGVVAEGKMTAGGTFEADTVLAKHDENYMPREVADALKKKGVWQHGDKKE